MGLRHLIQQNFWAKFLSFVLAFLVWLSIHTSEGGDGEAEGEGKIPVSNELPGPIPTAPATALTPLVSSKPKPASVLVKSEPFSRPVAILKPPSDSYAYEVKPAEIEVIVQGEKERLADMLTKEIRIFVDITDVLEKFGTADQHSGIPALIKVHTPPSIALESVSPNLVSVKRIPPPKPTVKPEPSKTTEIKPDERASTNSIGSIVPATNSISKPADAQKEASPKQPSLEDQKSAPASNPTPTNQNSESPPESDAGKDNDE